MSASFSKFWGLRFRDRVLRFRDRVLRFRDLGASFSSFGCFVFEFWVVLGASFSSFRCFVLRSSFSSASFSKLPQKSACFARVVSLGQHGGYVRFVNVCKVLFWSPKNTQVQ